MMLEETTNLFPDLDLDLSNNSIVSESFQIISTQRGKRKLLLDGYIYRLDRANDRGIEQWRCSKKSCRGRIHLHQSSRQVSTNITLVSSHSHAAEPAQCQAAMLVDHIRSSAQDNPHESPKEIVHRLLRSVNDETVANLPSVTAMQRSIQRRRQQQKSFDPLLINFDSDLDEEVCFTDEIQLIFCSIDDRTVLSSQYEFNANQILILTDGNQSTVRQRLAKASIWLCTTINEIKNDFLQSIVIVQILDQDKESFLPLAYALLPSTAVDFYKKFFLNLIPTENPQCILTNLDAILVQSLKEIFSLRPNPPVMKICSIFLHHELCKSFQTKRLIHDDEYKSLKYLLALAFIPSADILVAFESLQEISPLSIECIYDKFEDLCIGRLRPQGHRSQAVHNIELWNWIDAISLFDNLFLMNNNIKQWDEMFRTSLLASSHRTIAKIVRTIQQLHQHQHQTKIRHQQTMKTNRILQDYYQKKFEEILQSYSSMAFDDYLLHVIEYLPI